LKNILQLLLLISSILIFSLLGNYLRSGFLGAFMGGLTGLIVVNAFFTIMNYKKTNFPLRAISILLIFLVIIWFFLLL
jgi:hypothetical protein